jgi:hypothetical protein
LFDRKTFDISVEIGATFDTTTRNDVVPNRHNSLLQDPARHRYA